MVLNLAEGQKRFPLTGFVPAVPKIINGEKIKRTEEKKGNTYRQICHKYINKKNRKEKQK